MSSNLFSVLDKKPKSSTKDKKKKSADEKVEKKVSSAELEKAIFAQPLSNSNWADDDDEEEDAFEMEGGRAVDNDGWSRVPVRQGMKDDIIALDTVPVCKRSDGALRLPSQGQAQTVERRVIEEEPEEEDDEDDDEGDEEEEEVRGTRHHAYNFLHDHHDPLC